MAGAETALRAALAEDPSLPQISKNLADILYRNGRYDEAREAYERAAKLAPDLGDDLYFKLGQHRLQAARQVGRARESWSRATDAQSGRTSWPGPTSRCWTWPRDAPTTPAFAALVAPDRPDAAASRSRPTRTSASAAGSRSGCAPAACTPTTTTARCSTGRRDEYERLRDALTINVTRFYRNAETWNLLRRDVLPGAARRAADRDPGLERRAAPPARSRTRSPCWPPIISIAPDGATQLARLTIDATDIDRASLDRAQAACYRTEGLTEMPPTSWRGAYFEPAGDRAAGDRPRPPAGAGPAARPQPRSRRSGPTTTSSSAATS